MGDIAAVSVSDGTAICLDADFFGVNQRLTKVISEKRIEQDVDTTTFIRHVSNPVVGGYLGYGVSACFCPSESIC